jgi:hypothetical protein
MSRPPHETRPEMPELSPHWPGGLTGHDDPTAVESALAALKFGAILAAGATIVFFYLATYSGFVAPRAGASLVVLAAFVLPSLIAGLKTAWNRRRRRPPGA